MLTSIRLENFKCFERLELQPRRITVLIGPNGAGKSSVLQALMFLRQSLHHEAPQWQGPFVNLVGFPQALHSDATERELAIALEGERSVNDKRVGFSYRAAFSDEGLLANIGSIGEVIGRVGELNWIDRPLNVGWRRDAGQDPNMGVIRKYGGASFAFHVSLAIGSPHGRIRPDLSTLTPNEERTEIRQTQQRFLDTIADALESWWFGSLVRGFIKSSYPLASEKLKELRSAESYDRLSQEMASTLAYEKDIRTQVADWIKLVTEVPIEHRLDAGPEATVNAVSRITQGEIPIVNEGFGTNQLTWLLYQLVKTPEGGLAGIEEPETHLHPKAIARLGDVFVDIATKEDKQLLLATHSDHLLLSLLNNVAERKLTADDLAIYYFQLEDGKVSVRRQEVTDDGLVKGGLPGFFDAALEAQRRHLDAVTKHQPLEAVAQQP